MNEENKNPTTALDAICAPCHLTMAEVALLERIESKLVFGDISDTANNIVSVFALRGEKKPSEILKMLRDKTLEDNAYDWAATLDPKAFSEKQAEILDGIAEFWKMLPRPEEEKNEDGTVKKSPASETASSPS